MNNFIYHIPTKIYFGVGQLENIAEAVKYAGGKKVLIVYGGGSIKKSGVFDFVTQKLSKEGFEWCELGNIEPNPRIESVRKGIKLCRDEKIDLVLPIGGGSTIDAAKVIAAGVSYEGDPWDLVLDSSKIKSVLPIVTILTLSATGTEMDCIAVISNMRSNDKLGVAHPMMRPAASILDPTLTYTVNQYQTASGTADIMSHVLESYFTKVTTAFVHDKMCEGLLKTCIKYGPIALQNPENYEARANLMWASSWAINDFLKYGKGCPWSVHSMEHQLSAYYDITHGVGLAILTPHWMRHVLSQQTVDKFYEYGINVWDITHSSDKFQVANTAIEKTAAFFSSLGLPSTLLEVGIDETNFDIMAQKAATPLLQNAYVALNKQDVLSIYRASK